MTDISKDFWNIVLDNWTIVEIDDLAAEEVETYVPSSAVKRISEYTS